MAFLRACTSVEAVQASIPHEVLVPDTALANLPFTSMSDGSSCAKPPPPTSLVSSRCNAQDAGAAAAAGAHSLTATWVPPESGKLLRAQVLLKKEPEYPYAWKPHKAYLYDDGALVFVEQAPERSASLHSDLSGRSTPVKGKEARRLRLLLTKRWVVLSPSNETFKIGERGGNQDLFCTCQGASAKDREDWVDALMRLILSLDTTKDHAASPLASLQNVSVASGGIGGMFTQRQGWEADYPTDDSSDESESSSAYGDGHYRLAPRVSSKSVSSPAAVDANLSDVNVAKPGGRARLAHAAEFVVDVGSDTDTPPSGHQDRPGLGTSRVSAGIDQVAMRAIADAATAQHSSGGEDRLHVAVQQQKAYAEMLAKGKWVKVPTSPRGPASLRTLRARENPYVQQHVQEMQREAMATSGLVTNQPRRGLKGDAEHGNGEAACCGLCLPAQLEWWKTEGIKYVICALFLLTVGVLVAGILEALETKEKEYV